MQMSQEPGSFKAVTSNTFTKFSLMITFVSALSYKNWFDVVYNSATVTTGNQFMVNILISTSRSSIQTLYITLVREISGLTLIFHDS